MTNREVVETWFRRVWAERDTGAIDEMFAVDGTAEGLGGQTLIGPDDFRGFHAAFCNLMQDIEVTVDEAMEDGDWISVVCSLRGTSAKSGNDVRTTGSVWLRIEDGRILEAYNHWDFMRLYEELGLLPENASARALGGESL